MDIENEEIILFLKCARKNNLRYLCIGGYAVNYYGYHRSTDDMDIWIAPTKENKICFLKTLLCMNYAENEIAGIKKTLILILCSLGTPPNIIDVLTIVHKNIDFDDAEKESIVHVISPEIDLRFVPYVFLKEIKLRSTRHKDLYDITRLEEIRNKK